MPETMLEISQLRAGYGAINVLWDVSLSIQKGKLTTIIGPNGAGKTTLLRAFLRAAGKRRLPQRQTGLAAPFVRFVER